MTKFLVGFGIGVGAGFGVGFVVKDKLDKKKYNELVNKEVEEVKATLEQRYKAKAEKKKEKIAEEPIKKEDLGIDENPRETFLPPIEHVSVEPTPKVTKPKKKIYEIPEDSFGAEYDDYNEYVYWADGVVTDDGYGCERLEDDVLYAMVPRKDFEAFVSDRDKNIIFFRNEKEFADIQIRKEYQSYKEWLAMEYPSRYEEEYE